MDPNNIDEFLEAADVMPAVIFNFRDDIGKSAREDALVEKYALSTVNSVTFEELQIHMEITPANTLVVFRLAGFVSDDGELQVEDADRNRYSMPDLFSLTRSCKRSVFLIFVDLSDHFIHRAELPNDNDEVNKILLCAGGLRMHNGLTVHEVAIFDILLEYDYCPIKDFETFHEAFIARLKYTEFGFVGPDDVGENNLALLEATLVQMFKDKDSSICENITKAMKYEEFADRFMLDQFNYNCTKDRKLSDLFYQSKSVYWVWGGDPVKRSNDSFKLAIIRTVRVLSGDDVTEQSFISMGHCDICIRTRNLENLDERLPLCIHETQMRNNVNMFLRNYYHDICNSWYMNK